MEESCVGRRIHRKSSIESEPLTLNMDQMQFAREAALSVMNTRGIEEALRIFTEGLEPVVSVARQNGNTMMDSGEELDFSVNQHRRQQQRQEIRDIFSAPF